MTRAQLRNEINSVLSVATAFVCGAVIFVLFFPLVMAFYWCAEHDRKHSMLEDEG